MWRLERDGDGRSVGAISRGGEGSDDAGVPARDLERERGVSVMLKAFGAARRDEVDCKGTIQAPRIEYCGKQTTSRLSRSIAIHHNGYHKTSGLDLCDGKG